MQSLEAWAGMGWSQALTVGYQSASLECSNPFDCDLASCSTEDRYFKGGPPLAHDSLEVVTGDGPGAEYNLPGSSHI